MQSFLVWLKDGYEHKNALNPLAVISLNRVVICDIYQTSWLEWSNRTGKTEDLEEGKSRCFLFGYSLP